MTEVLTAKEIDDILTAINAGGAKPEKTKTHSDDSDGALNADEIDALLAGVDAGSTKPADRKPGAAARKIKMYDFKRPDKFSKEQIRTISIIHENFSHLITKELSALLCCITHVHIASVDQLTYEEFARSVPVPTTLGVIEMLPLGSAVIEIDPAISFAMIDRLLGGTGEGTIFQHELTNIETAIMEEVLLRMLGNLQKAWAQAVDVNPRLARIETNPQFAGIAPLCDMIVLVTLEARISGVEGMINICVPYKTIEPVIDNLSAACCQGCTPDIPNNHQLHVREDIPVTLCAEVFRRNYTIQEISGWKTETILLPHSPSSPASCFLRLGDRQVWKCEVLPDRKGFRKTIKITDFIDVPVGTEGAEHMDTKNPITASALETVKINITVELGAAARTVKEVYGMGTGAILELDTLASEPLAVKANGVLIAKGEAVVIDENFGVRIIEMLDAPADSDVPLPQTSSAKES